MHHGRPLVVQLCTELPTQLGVRAEVRVTGQARAVGLEAAAHVVGALVAGVGECHSAKATELDIKTLSGLDTCAGREHSSCHDG